jgi:hypothetical protein
VHRVVCADELDAVPRADRFESVRLGQRFQYAEGIERAGNCGWAVLDSGSLERGAEHWQIEAGVMGCEDSTAQKLEQRSCQLGEVRSIGDVGIPEPVDCGRLLGDRADGRTSGIRPGQPVA